MANIRIPAPLRPYAGGNSIVNVDGDNVSTALASLAEQFPELRQHLWEGDDLRSFVNLFLNKKDIGDLQGLDTPLQEDDTLLIIPSIAGGGHV